MFVSLNTFLDNNSPLTNYIHYLQSERTALLWASINGHNKVVEVLLTYGANIEAKDDVSINLCRTGHC